MATKFIPEDQSVRLLGQKEHEALVVSLLHALIERINRVELQLEKITDESIDCDDGANL